MLVKNILKSRLYKPGLRFFFSRGSDVSEGNCAKQKITFSYLSNTRYHLKVPAAALVKERMLDLAKNFMKKGCMCGSDLKFVFLEIFARFAKKWTIGTQKHKIYLELVSRDNQSIRDLKFSLPT